MATTPVDYALLRAEPWWGREFAPPNLEALYVGVRLFLGRGPEAVGGKGDNKHLRGYHRSREWILNSRYSLYGKADYSVQHPRDLAGDGRWYCAMDATPFKVETLIGMCQRLDKAVRAGELPQVREWYGNIDGNQIVDGWDAVTARAASSDSSHLWHLHISFFRSLANHDHTHLLAVLTGDDMPTVGEVWGTKIAADYLAAEDGTRPLVSPAHMLWRGSRDAALTLRVVEVIARKVDIDETELAALAAAVDEQVDEEAFADAVLARLAGRSAKDAADALRAVMSPEQIAALAAELATG